MRNIAHHSWKERASQKNFEARPTQIVKDKNQQCSFSLSWWKQKLEVEPRQFTGKDCHSAP